MSKLMILRRIPLAPPALRSTILPSRIFLPAPSLRYSTSIQSVTQPSFWVSLIPKAFRKNPSPSAASKKPKSKEWNPATFFIIIFLLIGSMSIQMIALRNQFATFSRRADAKISLLKDIIERIQKGGKVDVEGLLGTGDKEREKEWEEVLKEIEREDEAWEQSRKRKPKHGRSLNDRTSAQTASKTTNAVEGTDKQALNSGTKTNAPPGFY